MGIPMFYGEIDAYCWVLCTEKYFKRWGTPEKEKMAVAAITMRGHPLTWWLRWYPCHPWVSWDTFTTVFLLQFKPEWRVILPFPDDKEESVLEPLTVHIVSLVANSIIIEKDLSKSNLGDVQREEETPPEDGFGVQRDEKLLVDPTGEGIGKIKDLPVAVTKTIITVQSTDPLGDVIDNGAARNREPIAAHYVNDKHFVRRLAIIESFLGFDGTPPQREVQLAQFCSESTTETMPSLYRMLAMTPPLEPQNAGLFSEWKCPIYPPRPEKICTCLMRKCLSHARRHDPMQPLPPEPPNWTHGAVAIPPPPPEPPDLSCYVVAIVFATAKHDLPFESGAVSNFWGFEAHRIVSDSVRMAKGSGSGAPIRVVVPALVIAKVSKSLRQKNSNMTMASIISTCSQLRDRKYGRWIESHITDFGIVLNDQLATALLDLYAKCDSFDKAYELSLGLQQKVLVAHFALIYGYGINGRTTDASILLQNFVMVLKEAVLSFPTPLIEVGQFFFFIKPNINGVKMSKALSELHNEIPLFLRVIAIKIMEEELGSPLESCFSYNSATPMVATSYGQVGVAAKDCQEKD